MIKSIRATKNGYIEIAETINSKLHRRVIDGLGDLSGEAQEIKDAATTINTSAAGGLRAQAALEASPYYGLSTAEKAKAIKAERNAKEESAATNAEQSAIKEILAWVALQPSCPQSLKAMAKMASDARGRKV